MPLARWARLVYKLFQFIKVGGGEGGEGEEGACLFSSFLVEYKVCEVFDGVLVDIFHEGFDGWFCDYWVAEFVNGVFVHDTSYAGQWMNLLTQFEVLCAEKTHFLKQKTKKSVHLIQRK